MESDIMSIKAIFILMSPLSEMISWLLHMWIYFSHFLLFVFAFFITFLFCIILLLFWITNTWISFQNAFEVNRKFSGRLSFQSCLSFLFEEVNSLSWLGWTIKDIISKSILGSWTKFSISLAISGSTSIRLSSAPWQSDALHFLDLSISSYISCGYKLHINLWRNSLSGNWTSR